MVSSINPALPANAVDAVKGDLRTNLGFAKTEIEALQSDVASIGTSGAFQPMVDIRQFGTRNGTNDTAVVKTALTSIQTGANAGRVLWVPAGVYALPSFGSYVQSGPIRIRAEQGAIFDGVDAPNDWLNNPLLAQDGSDPNQFLLGTIRFLQFSTTGAAGSPGFPVDIEGLTFRNWTHVFRTTSVAHNNLIPLFRLHRCRFEKCYRGISTWAGAPVTYDRLEITYNTFFQCNVAIDWSGGRWQNVLVHGNFIDMCAREGFRFGYNTDPDIGLGVGILEQHEWRRVVWSFNCATRIGKSAFDPFANYTESNEVHCLRDYSEQVLLIGNMCYDCNAG